MLGWGWIRGQGPPKQPRGVIEHAQVHAPGLHMVAEGHGSFTVSRAASPCPPRPLYLGLRFRLRCGLGGFVSRALGTSSHLLVWILSRLMERIFQDTSHHANTMSPLYSLTQPWGSDFQTWRPAWRSHQPNHGCTCPSREGTEARGWTEPAHSCILLGIYDVPGGAQGRIDPAPLV